MIEGVSNYHDILLRDKVDGLRVLKLGIVAHAIPITVAMQIFWVFIATHQVP